MEINPLDWEQIPWNKTKNIPVQPGCYALIDLDKKEILYIGRSKVLCNRLHPPDRHEGFSRRENINQNLVITICYGWDIYEQERKLIKHYKPVLCKDI